MVTCPQSPSGAEGSHQSPRTIQSHEALNHQRYPLLTERETCVGRNHLGQLKRLHAESQVKPSNQDAPFSTISVEAPGGGGLTPSRAVGLLRSAAFTHCCPCRGFASPVEIEGLDTALGTSGTEDMSPRHMVTFRRRPGRSQITAAPAASTVLSVSNVY